LEFELHLCVLIVTHFRIHVENIQLNRKKHYDPPLQLTNLALAEYKIALSFEVEGLEARSYYYFQADAGASHLMLRLHQVRDTPQVP
jgi:hypothetical protein